jgi:hypothetical protein
MKTTPPASARAPATTACPRPSPVALGTPPVDDEVSDVLVVGTGRCCNPAVTVTGIMCPPNAMVFAPLLPISAEMVLKPSSFKFPVPTSV